LREVMPQDAVYVEETITHAGMLQQHLPWSQPQSFFRAGGGLGQGLGTALGVKLGAPKRPVAALVGDGSFLYNPVVQAFPLNRLSRREVAQGSLKCDESWPSLPSVAKRCLLK
jgi:acetolactate synthase-1/2/3 large subunit